MTIQASIVRFPARGSCGPLYELHIASPDGDYVYIQRITPGQAFQWLCDQGPNIESVTVSAEQLNQWTREMLEAVRA